MKSFSELTLPSEIQRALVRCNFSIPTEVQAQAIPVALTDRDLVACAQTGTGKTAAFVLPALVELFAHPERRVLVLAPTRELALQIEKVVADLSFYMPVRRCVLIGGVSLRPQIKDLQSNPQFLIATPGRLKDHLQQGTTNLQNCTTLVLDEADRMLDMGFAPQIDAIFRYMPKHKIKVRLFSATFPPEIQKLAGRYLHHPIRVQAGPPSQPVAKIAQEVLEIDDSKKNDTLLDQLNLRKGTVLIFARTKRRTDKLAKYLVSYGYPVCHIHGDRSQKQRTDAMDGFRSGKFRIMVATDIAARGIDVSGIAHVINYDLPAQPEDFVHRLGRTARGGRSGSSLSLITPHDRQQWRAIHRFLDRAR